MRWQRAQVSSLTCCERCRWWSSPGALPERSCSRPEAACRCVWQNTRSRTILPRRIGAGLVGCACIASTLPWVRMPLRCAGSRSDGLEAVGPAAAHAVDPSQPRVQERKRRGEQLRQRRVGGDELAEKRQRLGAEIADHLGRELRILGGVLEHARQPLEIEPLKREVFERGLRTRVGQQPARLRRQPGPHSVVVPSRRRPADPRRAPSARSTARAARRFRAASAAPPARDRARRVRSRRESAARPAPIAAPPAARFRRRKVGLRRAVQAEQPIALLGPERAAERALGKPLEVGLRARVVRGRRAPGRVARFRLSASFSAAPKYCSAASSLTGVSELLLNARTLSSPANWSAGRLVSPNRSRTMLLYSSREIRRSGAGPTSTAAVLAKRAIADQARSRRAARRGRTAAARVARAARAGGRVPARLADPRRLARRPERRPERDDQPDEPASAASSGRRI